MHICPQCQRKRLVHNGSAARKPKKRGKQCGFQLTRTTPRGKPLTMQSKAVLWYLSGMSMPRIAFLLQVAAQAVLNWIRAVAKDHCEKPKPRGRTLVLHLDAMWHYLKNKRQKVWIWKALAQETGPRLDLEGGRRDKATWQKMVDRLAPWDVTMSCTDKWAPYASLIPQDKLVQSKAMPHDIERNHGRQRHWFGQFKRKSLIVSQSQAMVDLTMALCAKFWVNGNQDALRALPA